ncbi:hypothetical protein ACGRHY_00140 [Streptomyces sp. HK10]|uniref:hypothetical protein n=1 Tax=Streptomyces sp. HK10 TaxID=3373255 RepID=UPI00374A4F26
MTAQNDRPSTPAEDGEPTQVLSPGGEATQVPPPAGETTEVLSPVEQSTKVPAPTGERASTVRLDAPAGGPASGDESRSANAEYSATILASHWIERPGPDGTTLKESPTTENHPTLVADRIESGVLRFGPGVTAAIAHRTHRTLPAVQPPPSAARRRWRRHALPTLVVLLVLAFLAWQRLGPPVAVREVSVSARPVALGCDDTADIVGLVTTNGRPGTLTYRWIRSDGTTSGVLREVVVRGQRQARLRLRWTFQGQGHHTARADLRIFSPAHRSVTTRLTYACP